MIKTNSAIAVQSADLSLTDLVPIYMRRRRLFFGIYGFILLCVVCSCIFSTRVYKAEGIVEVQKESVGGMELSGVFNGNVLVPDALTTGLELQTQAEILTSDALALKVIRELKLDQTTDYSPTFLNRVGYFVNRIPDPDAESVRTAHDLKVFSRSLKVKVNSGTRLIDVYYSSKNPELAASIVNHLIQGLIDFNLQARSAPDDTAAKWLRGQLGDLRKQSENLQAKVVGLQQQMGIFTVGDGSSTDKSQVYSTLLDQFQQANAALAAAQSNRILKGAVYEAVKGGNPELISGLSGNMMGGAASGLNNSLSVIQNLREQEALMSEDIARDASKFGDNYPPLADKRAALVGLQKSIADESARIAGRAKSDYDVAQQTEINTRKMYDAARHKADLLNDKAIEFSITKQEADETRGLYEDLTKHLREAGLVQGLRSSNIAPVDSGRIPGKPASPNIPLYVLAGIFGGLMVSSAGALFADIMDRRVQTVDEIEHGRVPLLGVIPRVKAKGGQYTLRDISESRSGFHHAMRGLRTALLLSSGPNVPRIVLVTSALPGEGKSTIAKGIALSAAQQGRKVLLIEADLYRPSLARDLGIDEPGGLSLLLYEEGTNPEEGLLTPLQRLPNLQVLQAGMLCEEVVELLGSNRMSSLLSSYRERFDTIVLDGPPVLPVSDAVSLSMLADTTLMVARMGQTPRIPFNRACNKLQMHNPLCDLRVVLNAVRPGSYEFHNYYGDISIPASKEQINASA